jgi:hypothetical protein
MPARAVRIHKGPPTIRLFMSDGSERSTYMPQEQAIRLLGAPHSGVNLMSCYYPGFADWPRREVAGPGMSHYRRIPGGASARTEEEFLHWNDGYYSFILDDPDGEVIRQVADVRRYGQEPRLTVTADADTPTEDIERMADLLKDFGTMQLRLNHEANGCTWFRFARNAGARPAEEARRIYHNLCGLFLRFDEVFGRIAPKVTLVACYQSGDALRSGSIERAEDLPQMTDEEFGPAYRLPGVIPSIDQYGSLHYGWPEHVIEDPPVIGPVDPGRHHSVYMTVCELCEGVLRSFHRGMCDLRGEPVRIDMGEANYDEDIHGPEIQAQLVYEMYRWISRHPDVIGSVTFYELTDRGGLGLFRLREYDNLEDLDTTCLLDVYRDTMRWPEFRHTVKPAGAIAKGDDPASLLWRSPCDAEGLELATAGRTGIDLRAAYWHHLVALGGDGRETHMYGVDRAVQLPPGTQTVRIFALPPDGRDSSTDGFRAEVPVPELLGE